jgi:integrase
LIAIMVYSFARIGAVIQMKVGDYFLQGRRRWVRLHEKGGKEHDVPCHHSLDQCLHDYIEAAGISDDVDGYLFRTARRKTGQLTTNPLFQQDAIASSAGARKQPASKRGLAIILSVRPALRRI